MQQPTREGDAPFKVPSLDTPCSTYYKVFGDLKSGTPAVVVLHGGPGAGHEYLLPFADLWPRYGLPVVFYDQIGCAASTRLPQTAGDKSLWQVALFVKELDNLIDHLQLRDGPGFHLLGQSWGGMFGAEYAAKRPRGLQRLVLASTVASKDLWIKSIKLLRSQLPPEVRQGLDEAERREAYDSPAYKDALTLFYKKHLCRAEPFPPEELMPTLKHHTEDRTVYGTMFGPSTLTATGTLLGWTIIPQLPQITAPTLIYNGEHDSSHDMALTPFFELIPRVRWITFADAGNLCHLESKDLQDRVLRIVGEFLVQDESTSGKSSA